MLGGSYLSHLATLVWLLLFTLWFVRTAQGGGKWYALGAGLALGMAVLTRSLTAAAYSVPFIVYSLIQVVTRWRQGGSRYLLVAAGAAALAILLPAYQRAVTGDPWLNPYLLWWPYDRLGFGPGIGAMPGGHAPHWAWINLKQDLSRAATDLLGWPALSFLPLILGLLLRPRKLLDWALLLPFGCLVVAYIFYWIGSPSRLWGPRYYFEGFACLWLLAAVGLLKVWEWGRVRHRWAQPVMVTLLVLLVSIGLVANLPARMTEARGFYGITRSQFQPIDEAKLHDALVIVYADRWLEYGAMLGSMSPTLDDGIVYARGGGAELDEAVIDEFSGRSVFYLSDGVLSRDPPGP